MATRVNIDRYDEFQTHMDRLEQFPDTPVNADLCGYIELQLNESISANLTHELLPKLTDLLFKLQQDSSALASLAIKLIKPLNLTDILFFTNEESLVLALRSPSPAANKLALEVIGKAADSSSNVARLSIMKKLVAQLLRTWLLNPHVGVAEKSSNVLVELLEVDCENPEPKKNHLDQFEPRKPGQGLLWRRIFHDMDTYNIILESTGSFFVEHDRSLAITRLFAVTVRLAEFSLPIIARPMLPRLEMQYGVLPPHGLLKFVATKTVLPGSRDILLRISYYQFWYDLLQTWKNTPPSAALAETLENILAESLEIDPHLNTYLESVLGNLKNDNDADDVQKLFGNLGLGGAKEGGDDEGMSM